MEPWVEAVERKVEGRVLAEAMHGDDGDSLGGDQRDECSGSVQEAQEAHEAENREKADKVKKGSRLAVPGGPCPP